MKRVVDFRRAIALLRTHLPPQHPVTVRRVLLPHDTGGYCELSAKRFQIRVRRDTITEFQIWILAHEWAHALCWESDQCEDHGPEWGIAMSRVYQVLF